MKLKSKYELQLELHHSFKVLYDLKQDFDTDEAEQFFRKLLSYTAHTLYTHRYKQHVEAHNEGATVFSVEFREFFERLYGELHRQEQQLPSHLARQHHNETVRYAISTFMNKHHQRWEAMQTLS